MHTHAQSSRNEFPATNWFTPVLTGFDQTLEGQPIFSSSANPVIRINPDKEQLVHVLKQYSLFPQRIVSLLCEASARAAAIHWDDVVLELHRNVGEELGSDSAGISHYQLLIAGAKAEFGIDVSKTDAGHATQAFLVDMHALAANREPAIAMGAVFALESTAGPELLIVRDLLTRLSEIEGRPGLTKGGVLDNFMTHHIDGWEPGHRNGLIATISKYGVSEVQKQQLTIGFNSVIEAMNLWWGELARECPRK